MIGTSIRVLMLVSALLLAACGTIATPVWEASPEPTEETGAVDVAAAPTDVEPTEVPPTAMPEPPTATPVPPTATTVPATATPVPPTAEPTEEATAEPAGEEGAGEEGETTVDGDPAAGEQLFLTGASGGIPCNTCHLNNSAASLVGPGLLGIPERAETRVEGQDAVEYIHTSIVEPDAHVVEGFPPSVMPPNYDEVYTEEQINDLVAYLLTLEE